MFMKKINYCFKILIMFFILSPAVGCVKSNDEKKAFIQKKQGKTNKEIAEKYGELVVPDFIKKGEYEFE